VGKTFTISPGKESVVKGMQINRTASDERIFTVDFISDDLLMKNGWKVTKIKDNK
jgi:hypothetical protein